VIPYIAIADVKGLEPFPGGGSSTQAFNQRAFVANHARFRRRKDGRGDRAGCSRTSRGWPRTWWSSSSASSRPRNVNHVAGGQLRDGGLHDRQGSAVSTAPVRDGGSNNRWPSARPRSAVAKLQQSQHGSSCGGCRPFPGRGTCRPRLRPRAESVPVQPARRGHVPEAQRLRINRGPSLRGAEAACSATNARWLKRLRRRTPPGRVQPSRQQIGM